MKLWVISQVYTNPSVLKAGLERYKDTKTQGLAHRQICYWEHYALASKEDRYACEVLAKAHGFEFLDSEKDLGSAQSFNKLLVDLPFEDDDFVITVDPDTHPDQPGWDKALLEVMANESALGFLSLTHRGMPQNWYMGYVQGDFRYVGDHLIFLMENFDMFDITCWRVKALKEIGGLKQAYPFHGQVEIPTITAMKEKGYAWGYLPYFTQYRGFESLQDPLFQEWKQRHHGFHWCERCLGRPYILCPNAKPVEKFNGSFGDFVASQVPKEQSSR